MNLVSINLSMNGLKSDSGIAFKEAVCDHTKLLKVNIEQNSVNVKDIEEIQRYLKRNRDKTVKGKTPHFKSELKNLIVTSKKAEYTETIK
jgi:hypothetical protein